MPIISVVMPVYNAAPFIRSAIDSILDQTIRNFEFLIIDDGSTDNSAEIIAEYDDPRIIILRNRENLGLAPSFNVGVKNARGSFIARMDADDISYKDRFEIQLAYLKKNPHIGLTGSGIDIMDENGNFIGKRKRLSDPLLVKYGLLYSNIIFHPTIMARMDILKNNLYDENFVKSEDFELWSRLAFNKNVLLSNVREPLLLYRSYAQSTTQRKNSENGLTSSRVILTNIGHYMNVEQEIERIIIALRTRQKITLRDIVKLCKFYRSVTNRFIELEKPNLIQRSNIMISHIKWSLNLIKFNFID